MSAAGSGEPAGRSAGGLPRPWPWGPSGQLHVTGSACQQLYGPVRTVLQCPHEFTSRDTHLRNSSDDSLLPWDCTPSAQSRVSYRCAALFKPPLHPSPCFSRECRCAPALTCVCSLSRGRSRHWWRLCTESMWRLHSSLVRARAETGTRCRCQRAVAADRGIFHGLACCAMDYANAASAHLTLPLRPNPL